MNFCWVTLHVDQMEESLNFYHKVLGLPISSQIETPEMKMVMLGEGNTKVELICMAGQKKPEIGNYTSIGFNVDSLEETRKSLEKEGIEILRGPISPNPHVQFMFIQDPNGYEVQLIENL